MNINRSLRAEVFVASLCETSFFGDFIFHSPNVLRKRQWKEHCDVLIVFGSAAIVLQIKTASSDTRAFRGPEYMERWIQKQYGDAQRQCEGAMRLLLDRVPIRGHNVRRGEIDIDCGAVKEVFGIAVVEHPPAQRFGQPRLKVISGNALPVLSLRFDEIANLLAECSTPEDLLDYFRFRRECFKKVVYTGNSELDILAYYRGKTPEAIRTVERAEFFTVRAGSWTKFQQNEQKRGRDRTFAESRVFDAILDDLHKSITVSEPTEAVLRDVSAGIGPKSTTYVQALYELSRLKRVERREVARKLLSIADLHSDGRPFRYFAVLFRDRLPMVFVVTDMPRHERVSTVGSLTEALCYRFHCRRAVGVGLNTRHSRGGSTDAVIIQLNPEVDVSTFPPDLEFAEVFFKNERRSKIQEFDNWPHRGPGMKFDPKKYKARKRKRR